MGDNVPLDAEAPRTEAAAPARAWLMIGPIVVQSSATLLIGLGMLVAGIVIGYLIRPAIAGLVANAPEAEPEPTAVATSVGPIAAIEQTQTARQAQALMEAVTGQTRHFRGDPDAPVTLIEFSDFQCPFCGRFATETLPQLIEAYVAGGEVRVGFQHFAFLGQESFRAAEAAECAAEQGAFWEYHDRLFANQAGENQGAFADDKLEQFAAALNLNTTDFNDCLGSGRYSSLVAAETQAAQQLGVRSTPTFLVNGQPIVGAQPYEVFTRYVDSALGR
jgi:protein-disulfide isomerase